MNENLNSTEAILEEMERTKWVRVGKTLLKDWRLYLLLIPMLVFIFLFRYMPIYGIIQGFKNYNATKSALQADWEGLTHIKKMFDMTQQANGPEFWRAFRNTFVNSMYGLIFGFPIPIFIALLFSEIKSTGYRSIIQVCVYLPNFLSQIVTSGIIIMWCAEPGVANAAGILSQMFDKLNWKEAGVAIRDTPKFFRPIYQISGVWEGAGYGSIVYFAAVMAISPTNYEAAKIDGATKMQQIRYVTLPGMAPTLSIMLILRIGNILSIGFEKVLLLYTTQSYETADVISTFVYRKTGRAGGSSDLPFGVVADLFNSLIAMCLVLGANAISRRVSETSLF